MMDEACPSKCYWSGKERHESYSHRNSVVGAPEKSGFQRRKRKHVKLPLTGGL
jgi:hypothetical protein